MDKEICSNCLLKKDSMDCKKSFCYITHFKVSFYELAKDAKHNINTITEIMNWDKKELHEFAMENYGMTPKKILDTIRLFIFIDNYDEEKEIKHLVYKSGFSNIRNLRNILRENYNFDKKDFINEVKKTKKSQEKSMKLKCKLLNIND